MQGKIESNDCDNKIPIFQENININNHETEESKDKIDINKTLKYAMKLYNGDGIPMDKFES